MNLCGKLVSSGPESSLCISGNNLLDITSILFCSHKNNHERLNFAGVALRCESEFSY